MSLDRDRPLQTIDRSALASERGFTLVAVVWIILLLSLLAGAVLALSIGARRTIQTLEDEARLSLVAESAVDVFMYRYFYDDDEMAHSSALFNLLGETIEVALTYEKGRLNINEENADVLSALLAFKGQEDEGAFALAQSILDWRDRDDNTRPGGAELAEYGGLGLSYGPRNNWFESEGELLYVLGMNREIYFCVLPFITVYSKQATKVDLSLADAELVDAFRWAYESGWQGASWTDPDLIESELGESQSGTSIAGNALRLQVTVQNDDPAVFETVVRFLSSSGSGVEFETIVPLRRVTFETRDWCASN